MTAEAATYFRPPELPGVEALHARFVEHVYRPHSHPTWTVAVLERGAARFEVDETRQRADRGELFVLEPEAVHTGMAAVPEGWAYKVLYLEPSLLHEWAERDAAAPGAARWVVFRDRALRDSLLHAHAALAHREAGLETHEAVLAEHWDQPVSLATLSSVAGLSRFELVRRFRRQTGLPPHAFQTNLRIARARALLAAGEPAASVAATCGFADQPHLTRVFKRAVGITPARYATA